MHKSKRKFQNTIKSGFMRSVTFPLVLIFIVFIVAIMLTVFLSFSTDLKNNIFDRKADELKVVENNITNRMSELNQINDDMYLSSEFLVMDNSDDRLVGHDTAEAVSDYLVGNDFIEYLGFYRLSTPNRIYSSKGDLDLVNFWGAHIAFDDMTADEFIEIVKQTQWRQVIPVMSSTRLGKEYLTIINSVPMFTAHPKAFSVAFIEKKTIDSYIDYMFLDSYGAMLITDNSGNPILSYDNGTNISDEELKSLFDELNEADGRVYRRINGKRYVIEFQKSSFNSWRYMSVVDYRDLMDEVYKLEVLLVIILSVLVLVAIFASVYIILIKFNPINQLAVAMADNGGTNSNGVIDENELLHTTFVKLMDEKKRVYDELFFSNLLAEQYDAESLADAMEEYQIRFTYSQYCTMAIFVEGEEPDKELVDRLRFYTWDLVNEYEDLDCHVIVTTHPRGLLMFMNCERRVLLADNMDEILSELINGIRKNFNVNIYIGIGNVRDDVLSFPAAVREATSAALYCAQKRDGAYITYEELTPDNVSEAISRCISEISVILKKGRSDELEVVFDRLKTLCERSHVSAIYQKYTAYSLSMVLLEYVKDSEREGELNLFLSELMTGNYGRSNIFDKLEEISIGITQQRDKVQKNQKDELLDNIKKAISDNLCDSMLSLDTIADACQISSSYLSRYFKQKMGITPMSYVENARMDIVKQKLRETDQSLNDILSDVGYIDKSNFIRKFKRREGITPMAYRKINA